MKHASELSLRVRLIAYVTVLAGYFLYCYNFVVLDFVRPYLVTEVGFTIAETGWIYSAGTFGVTLGAIVWAAVIARFGRYVSIVGISTVIGLMAAVQAASNELAPWIGARAVIAAALGGYYVVATSLVVALFPPHVRGRLIALNSATYAAANIGVAAVGAAVGDEQWRLLLWIAALPLPVAVLLALTVPRDRSYRAHDDEPVAAAAAGGWSEMLDRRWRWRTIGCVALSGIDFNAYQLFFSFVTLYAKTVRQMSAEEMGALVALISTGSLIGGFAWAFASDRRGRRVPLAGYVLASAAILAFLRPGIGLAGLSAAGFVFGAAMACTSTWGAWFAELFPVRLQPYGASLFHAGHVLALGSPLLASYVAEHFGLVFAMSLAALVYGLGALVWFVMPETLSLRRSEARPGVAG